MTEILAAVNDGGVVVVCILAVLAFGTGLAYTKGQHNSIIQLKDQQIADRDKIIDKERATNAALLSTLEKYEEPLKAVGHFFTSTLDSSQGKRG